MLSPSYSRTTILNQPASLLLVDATAVDYHAGQLCIEQLAVTDTTAIILVRSVGTGDEDVLRTVTLATAGV